MALSHQIYITDPRVEGPRPSPQQFIELHLAAWKQEATEKSLWTGESGLPNEKNRKRERQSQQQPLVETCRVTARKLGLLQLRKWGEAGLTTSRQQ